MASINPIRDGLFDVRAGWGKITPPGLFLKGLRYQARYHMQFKNVVEKKNCHNFG